MNELGKLFQRPEYIHVLLNLIPFYVLGVGVVILLVAIVRRERESQVVGLWTLVFACAAAWPTWYFGHQSYHHLYALLTTEGQRWADLHLRLTDRIVSVFYATGRGNGGLLDSLLPPTEGTPAMVRCERWQ